MDKNNRFSGGSDLPKPRKPVSLPGQTPSVQPVKKHTENNTERTIIMRRPTDRSDTQPLPPPVMAQQTPSASPARRTNQTGTRAKKKTASAKQVRPGKAASTAPRNAKPKPKLRANAKKKKKSPLLKVAVGLLSAAVLLFGIYSFVALRCISSLTKVESGDRTASAAGCLDESYVRNILLIGSDSRDGSRGRSDTMILVSINRKTNAITLVSFLRDSYVTLADGHGENRLNAAYSLGGPELLMDTLQNNYKIRIDDYVEVNFLSFASIVDAVGGVEITVSDAEATAINNILRDEVNALAGDAPTDDFLPSGGTYQLNGKQALSYSRIRKVGNADFERTERQRAVISGMVTSLKESGAGGIQSLAKDALPNLTTNMSTASLYGLSLRAPFLLGYDINQLQIPADGTWQGATINGASVLTLDLDANRALLEETLYASEAQSGD